jgi:phage shock protein C
MKKLYRSNTNKIFAGLLGGIGEYFDVDPVWIRLVFVALVVLTMGVPGIIIYILGLLIVPLPLDREIIRDAEIVDKS